MSLLLTKGRLATAHTAPCANPCALYLYDALQTRENACARNVVPAWANSLHTFYLEE